MDAKTYFTERDGKVSRDGTELTRCAAACGVTPGFLYMVVLGHKPASPALACNLEHATTGYVDRRDTLPTFPWDRPTDQIRATG
jgi:DNA-binding transcriptional regulator YdaS (Cro superfamily)